MLKYPGSVFPKVLCTLPVDLLSGRKWTVLEFKSGRPKNSRLELKKINVY